MSINLDRANWPKRWITADWHLGEERMQIMQRPFQNAQEHVDRMVELHNQVVHPDDLVILVGDAVNKDKPEFLEHVGRFNGTKVLVRGNHDVPYSDEQLSDYFVLIVEDGDGIELSVEVEGSPLACYATHYPTQGREDRYNLVGHIHSAWKLQLNSVNVGVDCNHFAPHNLDESVPFLYTASCKFYDDDVWAAYADANLPHLGHRGKKGRYFQGAK